MTLLLAAIRPALPAILGLSLAVGIITVVYWIGQRDGAAKVQAEWAAEREALRVAEAQAIARREAEEARLARHMKEQTDAHTATVERLRAAESAAGRELVRLRAAIATAAVRDRQFAPTAATGPQTDGATAGAGELLTSCAGELAEMGAAAGELAAQVIGLQQYARAAQQVCGGSP